MPFDPTKPSNNSPVSSAELRSQFNELKTLIDNIPAGPQGEQGPAGPQGPQGEPGPVTLDQLGNVTEDILAQTAHDVSDIGDLETTFSDPPTLADLESIKAKLNELIGALKR